MGDTVVDGVYLVVRMDDEVESHELREEGIVVSEHTAEVGRPILLRVDHSHLQR